MILSLFTSQDVYFYPFISLLFLYMAMLFRRKNKSKDREDIIDLYHHGSREAWCTVDTCRMLTSEECAEVREARKQKRLISARWVNIEEGKKAKVWGEDHKATRIYGHSYKII